MCSVTQNNSATSLPVLPIACASSSMVGMRARFAINCRRARSTWANSRSTCTGTRTVRLWCISACCTASRIHHTAYVEKRSLRSRIEFLDGAHQTEIALGDQIEQRHAAPDIAARDGDDQTQVRLDHLPARFGIAGAHERRQAQLVVGAQQRNQTDFVEVGAGRIARFLVLRLDRVDQLEQVFGFEFGSGKAQPCAQNTPVARSIRRNRLHQH